MNTTTDLIKRLRASGLSQSEISRRTGIPQPRLSRWEAGDTPSAANDALKLADLAAELEHASPPESSGDTVQPVTAVTEGAPAAEGGDERHHQEPIAFGNRRQREGTKADRGHTGGAA